MRARILVCGVAMLGAAACRQARPESEQDIAQRLRVSSRAVEWIRAGQSMSTHSLREMSPADAQKLLRNWRPDLQQRRAAYRNLLLRGSNGTVPTLAWLRAFAEV